MSIGQVLSSRNRVGIFAEYILFTKENLSKSMNVPIPNKKIAPIARYVKYTIVPIDITIPNIFEVIVLFPPFS